MRRLLLGLAVHNVFAKCNPAAKDPQDGEPVGWGLAGNDGVGDQDLVGLSATDDLSEVWRVLNTERLRKTDQFFNCSRFANPHQPILKQPF